jgi:hypothetical protein
VAQCTQADQVRRGIIAGLTAKLFVVDLNILHATAQLATESVPSQDFAAELPVRVRVQSHSWTFRLNAVHDAFSLISVKKASLCSPDRNLKNSRMDRSNISGSPLSTLAPARKSAQIISRQ